MKLNLIVQLDQETVEKARALAARRSTSVSRLVSKEIQRLVDEDDAYQRSLMTALAHLGRGSPLGGGRLPGRDSLHER